jgi:hypothetical protein
MQVFHFGIGSSTTPISNNNCQNMQYEHMGFKICNEFLDPSYNCILKLVFQLF